MNFISLPSSWALIRRSPFGRREEAVQQVAAHDIGFDGAVIYSNGCGVFIIDSRNQTRLILREHPFEEVAAA